MASDRMLDVDAVLESERLVLRALRVTDADRLVELADDYEVAAGVLTMPHPYTLADAEAFIAYTRDRYYDPNRTEHIFGARLKPSDDLIGVVGLSEARPHRRAEMGYWIGRAYWGNGYATEAGRLLLAFGFTTLGLGRIHAACYTHNVGSARVMEKMGMRHEGTLRRHYVRFGSVYDAHVYGILRDEWNGPDKKETA